MSNTLNLECEIMYVPPPSCRKLLNLHYKFTCPLGDDGHSLIEYITNFFEPVNNRVIELMMCLMKKKRSMMK